MASSLTIFLQTHKKINFAVLDSAVLCSAVKVNPSRFCDKESKALPGQQVEIRNVPFARYKTLS